MTHAVKREKLEVLNIDDGLPARAQPGNKGLKRGHRHGWPPLSPRMFAYY